MNTKIICFYLPQFHETEENNKWWGEGYTDWIASKNAKPLFKGHDQPRIPLNQNYYDLSEESAATLKWQAELAKEYGIYGFCIYHYWFPQKQLLDKPVEILRKHKEIDIHYTLCWDSSTWKRNWYADQFESEILMQQEYGNEEIWKRHFYDLLPDFQDERYIKIHNRPVFHIYRAAEIPCLTEMRTYWDGLAKENGFDGIYLIAGDVINRKNEKLQIAADAFYNYEPQHTFHVRRFYPYVFLSVARAGIVKRINKYFHLDIFPDKRSAHGMYREIARVKNYGKKKSYYGVFSDYDDTPRRQIKGAVYTNNHVKYFEQCMKKQLSKSEKEGKEFLYITAWNEWGESAYMEPDEEHGYAFLEAVRRVVTKK